MSEGEGLRPPTGTRRLVLVFCSPVAQEIAALADRLAWPVTVIDPDRTRLDADPIPYARTSSSVAGARLDAGCEVVVCDPDRPELLDLLIDVLAGPGRRVGMAGPGDPAPYVVSLRERGVDAQQVARVHRPVGLDLGARTPAETALATVAGLLAERNGTTGGPLPFP